MSLLQSWDKKKSEAQCIMCKTFTSVANRSSYDLKAYINSAKQTQDTKKNPYLSYLVTPQKSVNFLLNRIQKQKNKQ
jgi:hypothetical protein